MGAVALRLIQRMTRLVWNWPGILACSSGSGLVVVRITVDQTERTPRDLASPDSRGTEFPTPLITGGFGSSSVLSELQYSADQC